MHTTPSIDLDAISPAQLEATWEQDLPQNPDLQMLTQVLQEKHLPNRANQPIPIYPGALDKSGAQLLYHLTRTLAPPITIETGFGFGISALAFLAAHRQNAPEPNAPTAQHIAIDPSFRQWTQEAGFLMIQRRESPNFHLLEHPALFALPQLLYQGLLDDLKLALIDGSHLFDHAMLDFCMLDRNLATGGILIFDDADAPAVQTLLNFIETNHQYHIKRLGRCALAQKVQHDQRPWDHFAAFDVCTHTTWPS